MTKEDLAKDLRAMRGEGSWSVSRGDMAEIFGYGLNREIVETWLAATGLDFQISENPNTGTWSFRRGN